MNSPGIGEAAWSGVVGIAHELIELRMALVDYLHAEDALEWQTQHGAQAGLDVLQAAKRTARQRLLSLALTPNAQDNAG